MRGSMHRFFYVVVMSKLRIIKKFPRAGIKPALH